MQFERSAGILLHPTSLPGKFGIGDLGSEAYKFIDFLKEAGQTLWQTFPLGPTGYGDSPYQCFSAFAGNPLLVSPEKLMEDNFLTEDDLKNSPHSDPQKIDYGQAIDYKKSILKKAFNNFKNNHNGLEKDFEQFCENHKDWLNDFSFFMACKDYNGGAVWSSWEKGLVQRDKKVLAEWEKKLSDEIKYQKFVQFSFFRQWKSLKEYALWANKELFTVDEEGKLTFVAGVPPDYFSKTGQLWGNPLYKWEEMEKDNFLWWRKRFSSLFELVDIVRIDHFRGFEANCSERKMDKSSRGKIIQHFK